MADVVEAMSVEFSPALPLPTIVNTVRQCRRELEILTGPQAPTNSNDSPDTASNNSPPKPPRKSINCRGGRLSTAAHRPMRYHVNMSYARYGGP